MALRYPWRDVQNTQRIPTLMVFHNIFNNGQYDCIYGRVGIFSSGSLERRRSTLTINRQTPGMGFQPPIHHRRLTGRRHRCRWRGSVSANPTTSPVSAGLLWAPPAGLRLCASQQGLLPGSILRPARSASRLLISGEALWPDRGLP